MKLARIGIFLTILVILSGCGGDEPETVISPLAPEDGDIVTTAQRNANAGEIQRRADATAALKRYIQLKDRFPDAARKELLKHANIIFKNHPLAEEWTDIVMQSDLAGKMTLNDAIRWTEIRLQVEQDKPEPDRDRIAELERELLQWKEFPENEEQGVHIQFSIQLKDD